MHFKVKKLFYACMITAIMLTGIFSGAALAVDCTHENTTVTTTGSTQTEICDDCGATIEEISNLIPDGWNKINNVWYYYKNNAPLTGLQTVTGYQRSGSQGENQYYFNADGTMYYGFKKINDAWYFFCEATGSGSPKETVTGQMLKDYYVIAPTQGYLSSSDKKAIANGEVRRYAYFFDANGAMYKGWHNDNLTGGKWMYFGEEGYSPITSTVGRRAQYGRNACIGNNGVKTYYAFNDNGVMLTGPIKYGNTTYNFCKTGVNPATDKLGSSGVVIATTSSSGSSSSTAKEYYQVTSSTLNMRKAPGTSYKVVAKLTKGVELVRLDSSVVSENGYKWYYVQKVGTDIKGYVATKYIKSIGTKVESNTSNNNNSTTTTSNEKYEVTANTVNMRKSPGTSYKVVTKLTKGMDLIRLDSSVVEKDGYKWYYVQKADTDLKGYVVTKYIKYTGTTTGTTPEPKPEITAPEPVEEYYIVTSSTLNMRKAPGTSYKVVKKLTRGMALVRLDSSVVSEDGYKWYYVQVSGTDIKGYVSTKYVARMLHQTNTYATVYKDSATGQSYVTYRQGNTAWGFSSSVKKVACVTSSYAMLLTNAGIFATPRTVYNLNNATTSVDYPDAAKEVGAKAVCALASDSQYLSSYEDGRTYVKSPSKNGEKAVREALDRNPEGVLLYFRDGGNGHAIVAVKYNSDGTIYYCDPGRTNGSMLTYKNTWCYYKHRMTYADLQYMAAIDVD